MKVKWPLVLSCGVTSLLCLGAGSTVQRFSMDYIYITPAHSDKEHKSRIFFKLRANTGTVVGKLVNFYVYNSQYKTGTRIKNCKPTREDGVYESYFTTYTFVDQINEVHVFFYDEDSKKNDYVFTVPIDDNYPTVDVGSLSGEMYRARNVACYDKKKGFYNGYNDYIFKNWYDQEHLSVYNKVDMSKFTFQERIGSLFIPTTYESFYLTIPTEYEIFDDATNEEKKKGYIKFDINLVEKTTALYALQFVDTFYVNPNTHKMLRKRQPGFYQTKYIYLPKDGFGRLDKLTFSIFGTKIGTMMLDFKYVFSVQSDHSRIGDCVSSKYCIKTEESTYSEYGKELIND